MSCFTCGCQIDPLGRVTVPCDLHRGGIYEQPSTQAVPARVTYFPTATMPYKREWQKCPVCEGKGTVQTFNIYGDSIMHSSCHRCNGIGTIERPFNPTPGGEGE